MCKWGYRTFNRSLSEYELNEYGKEGWELISHTAICSVLREVIQYYVFKREIKED